MFNGTIYNRGGMTLQALREKIGDSDFFEILKRWAAENRYGNVTTPEFIALANEVTERTWAVLQRLALPTGEAHVLVSACFRAVPSPVITAAGCDRPARRCRRAPRPAPSGQPADVIGDDFDDVGVLPGHRAYRPVRADHDPLRAEGVQRHVEVRDEVGEAPASTPP